VCDVFRGQEVCRTDFAVTRQAGDTSFLPEMGTDLGVANRLTLLDDELLRNLRAVQLRGGRSLGAAPAGPRRIRCHRTGAMFFAPLAHQAPLNTQAVKALLAGFP
jgi:hypothetical protein